MKFEIDFNRENNDKLLVEGLGAYWETKNDNWGDFVCIEIKDFEQLKELLEKVESLTGSYYDAVISFDPPTIFLDKDV